jgi:hypothetical protein
MVTVDVPEAEGELVADSEGVEVEHNETDVVAVDVARVEAEDEIVDVNVLVDVSVGVRVCVTEAIGEIDPVVLAIDDAVAVGVLEF